MWELLRQLTGQRLMTLAKQRPFTIVEVSDTAVVFETSTGRPRRVSRVRIEAAWRRLTTTGSLVLQEMQEFSTSLNRTYVAAMLSKLPGVVTEPAPVRLRYLVRKEARTCH